MPIKQTSSGFSLLQMTPLVSPDHGGLCCRGSAEAGGEVSAACGEGMVLWCVVG